MCVDIRARNLRQLGYQDVTADRKISFSDEDAFKDAGLFALSEVQPKNSYSQTI